MALQVDHFLHSCVDCDSGGHNNYVPIVLCSEK